MMRSILFFNHQFSRLNLHLKLAKCSNAVRIFTQRCWITTASTTSFNSKVIQKPFRETKLISQSDEWITIYRFPYIVHCRIISRAKLYMTFFTTIIVPILYFTTGEGYELVQVSIIAGISGFSLAVLYVFGNFFRRLIGSIYVSPDERLVRISHLTFFGNRAEKIVPIDDLMLLTDSNANIQETLLRVQTIDERLGGTNALFICIKYGGIIDGEKFSKIFGTSIT